MFNRYYINTMKDPLAKVWTVIIFIFIEMLFIAINYKMAKWAKLKMELGKDLDLNKNINLISYEIYRFILIQSII